MAYDGASPHGLVYCDCGGRDSLEIKCLIVLRTKLLTLAKGTGTGLALKEDSDKYKLRYISVV